MFNVQTEYDFQVSGISQLAENLELLLNKPTSFIEFNPLEEFLKITFTHYKKEEISVNVDINLPSDTKTAKIGVPSTSGFSNYTTQERGVVWNLKTGSEVIMLHFYFYTLGLLHHVSGAQINRVIPIDGNKIQIPYYFGY